MKTLPFFLVATAFVLVLAGCDHKEDEHEDERPHEIKPVTRKEEPAEQNQQREKKEEQELERSEERRVGKEC